MKKKYLRINIAYALLFGSICIANCTYKQKEDKSNTTPSKSYEKKLISYKEGTVLFDEYSKTNNQILTKFRNGEPDSRWYWLSIEDLEGYIKYVKDNAKGHNPENLGLRIYLGKYPNNYPKEKMAKPEYAGYQTIFIVPTAKMQPQENVKSFSSLRSVDENADLSSISALNMLNLAPPPKVAAEQM